MDNQAFLTRFGFKFIKSSTHMRRTIMFDELSYLLSYVSNNEASKNDYINAITKDNCLSKRSVQNRKFTSKYLTELYGLDPELPIFRALLYFWGREERSRSLLALLCAYTRDPLLRLSMPFIIDHQEEQTVERVLLEEYIDKHFPGRFSQNTLISMAQNLNATWTKSGHLKGRAIKTRVKVSATPGATAYALFLAYLAGGRGRALFQTEYVRLLDSTEDVLIELAGKASSRGWLIFNRVADVLEVQFPNLLTSAEMRWVYEQTRAPAE
jgi:hypothetical protein